ncbi:aspartate ammonia-lyase [Apilactobacillus ozensis DSM 23829 = JCM 17196]|uniref:Aspartate ammonia-lyase n=2 Tax=Apilactobacillus ozensis TaxID=866801 RepID=A0A0R2AVM4_9LACO|nr:aspartate ammonia-lyase [Apilactobacillus ozensis DSM 23829 = JCM 17196]
MKGCLCIDVPKKIAYNSLKCVTKYYIGDAKMRIDQDCLGKMEVKDDALYGIHSLRAVHNFPITSEKVHPAILESMLEIKLAAAKANLKADTLSKSKADAIINACKKLIDNHDYRAFIVPAIQGGAGTSTNMSANEVVAQLAYQMTDIKIHPNDDVNQSQSTNDTFPTAGKMGMLKLAPKLLQSIDNLINQFTELSIQHQKTIKIARTQLQDAIPTTYGRSFKAYASLFKRDYKRIRNAAKNLTIINLGGTAIGNGLNASEYYQNNIVPILSEVSGLNLQQADDLIDATQNCDSFAEFSGALKTLAMNLSKVANDLRLLSSGPQTGLNEISLPKKAAGSSIMPGKINPVIPEVVNQVAFEVIGKNLTVSLAAEGGQLELNAFEPIMFRDILTSEEHLTKAIETLINNCLKGIQVNAQYNRKNVEKSAITATVLTPKIGYEKATSIVKEALNKNISVKKLVLDKQLLDSATVENLFSPEVLTNCDNQDSAIQ